MGVDKAQCLDVINCVKLHKAADFGLRTWAKNVPDSVVQLAIVFMFAGNVFAGI